MEEDHKKFTEKKKTSNYLLEQLQRQEREASNKSRIEYALEQAYKSEIDELHRQKEH